MKAYPRALRSLLGGALGLAALSAASSADAAVLRVTCDDAYTQLYLDGAPVTLGANAGTWTVYDDYNLTLTPGDHVIALRANDLFGSISMCTWVLYDAPGGNVLATSNPFDTVTQDSAAPANWFSLAFDDSAWPAAINCGGPAPWNLAFVTAARAYTVWNTPGCVPPDTRNVFLRQHARVRGCGDGSLDAGEACDDGNTTAGDGCSATCALEAGFLCTRSSALANAGFESGAAGTNLTGAQLPGWTITSGNIDHGAYPHTEGASSLDLTGCTPGTIYQDIATVAGQTYTLRFDYGANSFDALRLAAEALRADGVTVLRTHTFEANASVLGSRLLPGAITFTALDATTRLRFRTVAANGCGGNWLDNVQLGLTSCVRLAVALAQPANGSVTANTTPTLTGTATAGQTVTISVDGVVLGTATADAMGNWSLPWPTGRMGLANGMHSATATIPDGVGGTLSSATAFTVGCVLNSDCSGATPACNTATHLCRACAVATQGTDCGAGTVCNGSSGACVAPAVTVSAPTPGSQGVSPTPTLGGTATPGQTVTISVDGVVVGTAVASNVGSWTLPWPTGRAGLSNGMHTATGVVGSTTSAPDGFTVGCNDSSVCSGATPACNTGTHTCVQCTSNANCSGTTPACNTASNSCRPCAVPTQGTDCGAGTVCNGTSGACVAPSVTLRTPASGSTQPPTPTLTGTATPGQTVTISVDGAVLGMVTADASGNWSLPWPAGRMGLANGSHSATATAPNGAGVVSAGPNGFTVGCQSNSDCAGATPVCNTATSTCVQCTSSANCSGTTPVCNTSSNTCRACAVPTQGSDCASGTVCNGTSGACVSPVLTLATPSMGAVVPGGRPTISGTATPGQTVTISVDGVVLGTVTADALGNWSLPYPAASMALGNGRHTASASESDGAGGARAASNDFTVGCAADADCSGSTPFCNTSSNTCRGCMPAGVGSADCTLATAPFCSGMGATSGQCVAAPPVVRSPADGASTPLGRPTIRGTGPANSTVQVVVDGVPVGTARTDASGNWSLVPPMTLAPGMHSVSAANVTGGVVGPQGATNSFTVTSCATNADCSGVTPVCDAASRTCRPCDPASAMDCSAPRPTCSTSGSSAGMCVATVPTLTSPADGSMTASRRPEVRGVAAPGSTVSIQIDGMEVGRAMADNNGDFVFTPTMDLSLGNHSAAAAPVTSDGDAGADASAVGMPGPVVRFAVTSCAASSECSGGTPLCDATSRTCRACDPTNAMDCPDPTRPVCATSGPSQGRCVARVPTVSTPADGSTTSMRRPPLTGTGSPGSTVVVLVDGMEVGRATVDASGQWSVTLTGDLGVGMHSATAANANPDGTVGTTGMVNNFRVVECTTSAECAGGRSCDTASGRCVSSADGGMEGGADASFDGRVEAGSEGGAEAGAPGRLAGAGACGCRVAGVPSRDARGAWGLCALGLALALASRRRR